MRAEIRPSPCCANAIQGDGGGVSLCLIDATLHLLARLLGPAVADETARIMEYRTARAANAVAFPAVV